MSFDPYLVRREGRSRFLKDPFGNNLHIWLAGCGRAAALQMLAMPMGIAALCALHRISQPAAKCTTYSRTGPNVRGLRYHILEWGDQRMVTPDRPALVMAHGWMDVGASFQFVVDELPSDRYAIALDWRGFGLTESPPAADCYWFPDYLGDSRIGARPIGT